MNIFEIDYLQLCFSELDGKLTKESLVDIILSPDQIVVDNLRVNYQNTSDFEKSWDSFKLKITDKVAKKSVNEQLIKIDFANNPKVKVLCKLKPAGKMIIRCTASITQSINGDNISYSINILK
ncbi:hypothetical protein SSYRP_v1c06540 [Spiroplasma syrphidicola EA-1]|uniref:Uncharacterized protein n=1 Tax=Spiroplasma syrphidicola EA-1 TaxID=1276229 RepID=R4UEA5_9MOLU|nr:hypothetical protein [Spiroplasma syrphidicola]AGM26244.1 hypothetical protein SSYRP_v1c06540 [Spiroplasma syrphidicola EA-1]